MVCNLVEHAPLAKATSLAHYQSLTTGGPGLSRKQLGLFVRELAKQSLGDDWKLAIHFALIWEWVQAGVTVEQLQDISHSVAQSILLRFTELLKAIDHHDLNRAHQYKTLIDVGSFMSSGLHEYLVFEKQGKTVAKVLGVRPGPTIGAYLQKVMDFQLEHPSKTQEDCVAWLQDLVKKEKESKVE